MMGVVKKVLGIGILLGIFLLGFGFENTEAQVDRYDCSRFNPAKHGGLSANGNMGQCKLSNKCHVEGYDAESDSEKLDWQCVADDADKAENEAAIFKGTNACSNINDATESQKNDCTVAANIGEDACKNLYKAELKKAAGGVERSIIRNLEKACEAQSKKTETAVNAADETEYAPFGIYEGASFGGPGLKAGSRIAKSKLDNTISKEKSIKKLAIGWVNLALSLVAILAVIAVIYAGILYITSMGDDGNKDKAKNIIVYVAAGILLIFGSYAIVKAILGASLGNVVFTKEVIKLLI